MNSATSAEHSRVRKTAAFPFSGSPSISVTRVIACELNQASPHCVGAPGGAMPGSATSCSAIAAGVVPASSLGAASSGQTRIIRSLSFLAAARPRASVHAMGQVGSQLAYMAAWLGQSE